MSIFFALKPDMLVDADVFVAESNVVSDAGRVTNIGDTVNTGTIQKLTGSFGRGEPHRQNGIPFPEAK